MSLGACTDFTTELVCYDDGAGNLSTLVAHYEYGKSVIGSTILVSTRYTQVDGTPVNTAAGTVTAGACPVGAGTVADKTVDHFAINIADGAFAATHDPEGNGQGWVYSGSSKLQAVTVTALEAADMTANYVQLTTSAGDKSYLLKGQTISFSVAQQANRNELLNSSISVVCMGDAAAYVAWTEDQ